MSINEVMLAITTLVKNHQSWAPPIVFILAFSESLAFLSLLVPATVILLAIGALIGESGIAFLPVWLAAVAGAFCGDWISYWFGFHFKERVAHLWPFSRQPELLVKGQVFFDRWGVWGVFFGRFLGPFRAVVPLIAGICAMNNRHFQLANLLSALLWGFLMLAPGSFGLPWLMGLLY